jgi:serine/threonine protein phosphatase PrpC
MATQGIVLTLFGQSIVGKDRSNNEDAFVMTDLGGINPLRAATSPVSLEDNERGVLIAVSDGMGGAKAGEVASAMVLDVLQRGMSTVRAISVEAALRQSIDAANERVFNTARETGRAGMGATLTAMLFHGLYAHIAEIGDSRAYLLRGNRLVRLTHDQSYVQRLIDKGTLTEEQAKSSDYQNVILQAMGINASVTPVVSRVTLRRHDRFLVCTDGICGVLDDRMMLNLILGSTTLESACAKLIVAAVSQGSDDDITAVVAEVDGEGVPLIDDEERLSLETAEFFQPV